MWPGESSASEKGKMAMGDFQRVLVVGAGTMGHGFAQLIAINGIDVFLVDQSEEFLSRGMALIVGNLAYMVELGELAAEEVEPALSRIEPSTDMEGCARKAECVFEAVSENLSLKQDVFRRLDEAAPPEVILSTNTSSYDINALSAVTRHPERVIGAHWFHPPQITPCVEVIPGKQTSPSVIETMVALLVRLGKYPTLCRSAPGFVANRIQFAMAAEALAIVAEGLATPEEVDRIVKSSFGFRLGAYGPFEIADQAGIDTYKAIFEYLHEKLAREQFKPAPMLSSLVEESRLGLKAQKGFYDYEDGAADRIRRRRDKRLYARLRLFRDEQSD